MVQRDKGLLNNRIHLLEMEEQKVLKKIESTRKRAQQIESIRAANDERF